MAREQDLDSSSQGRPDDHGHIYKGVRGTREGSYVRDATFRSESTGLYDLYFRISSLNIPSQAMIFLLR